MLLEICMYIFIDCITPQLHQIATVISIFRYIIANKVLNIDRCKIVRLVPLLNNTAKAVFSEIKSCPRHPDDGWLFSEKKH